MSTPSMTSRDSCFWLPPARFLQKSGGTTEALPWHGMHTCPWALAACAVSASSSSARYSPSKREHRATSCNGLRLPVRLLDVSTLCLDRYRVHESTQFGLHHQGG